MTHERQDRTDPLSRRQLTLEEIIAVEFRWYAVRYHRQLADFDRAPDPTRMLEEPERHGTDMLGRR